MHFIPFTENKIRETFTHFFNTMHLSAYEIATVDINGGVAHILRDQHLYIDLNVKKEVTLTDKDMSTWLDSQVQEKISKRCEIAI